MNYSDVSIRMEISFYPDAMACKVSHSVFFCRAVRLVLSTAIASSNNHNHNPALCSLSEAVCVE